MIITVLHFLILLNFSRDYSLRRININIIDPVTEYHNQIEIALRKYSPP